jgi:hypothetical protein
LSADLVDGDDAGVAQLGGADGLAQEAIQVVGRVTDVVAVRHLDGHDPVQFGVPGLVHSAKGAMPHGFDQRKLSEPVSAGPPVGRGPGLQVEGGAARGASDLLLRGELEDLDGVAAVRAKDVHGRPPIPFAARTSTEPS